MHTVLQDKHVLILGLGHSGLAMARWCARQGARLTVADTRAQPPELATLRAELPQARFVAGELSGELVQGSDVRAVYCSPGLSPQRVAAVVAAARQRGLPVAGEVDLFARALARLADERDYHPAVLAVTGTNGKTTVTDLAGTLVRRAGRTAAVAGNIGDTLLDTLGRCLDAEDLPQVWVLELSSFQLHAAHDFNPTAAALLNLSQDHLDWHGSMDAYVQDKARIFGPDTIAVLNRDDEAVMALLPQLAAHGGSGRRRADARSVLTFGATPAPGPGDFGLASEAGLTWLMRNHPAPEGARRRRRGPAEPVHAQHLMPAEELHIQGRHNALNALAALALATCAGCTLAPMLYALREYRGQAHRTQSLGVIDGVEYFDDSKGTNVGATVAAIEGLGAGRRLVLILGGDGKGQDFAPLAAPVAEHARAVVLLGRDADLIGRHLKGGATPLLRAHDLGQAVALASEQARAGDAVLLSPACASFDMFDSYLQRAQAFADAVRERALAHGVELPA